MDLGGSVQTSIFAYLSMTAVAMLAAVMVRGIVIVLQRAQRRRKAEIAPTPVSIAVAKLWTKPLHTSRPSLRRSTRYRVRIVWRTSARRYPVRHRRSRSSR